MTAVRKILISALASATVWVAIPPANAKIFPKIPLQQVPNPYQKGPNVPIPQPPVPTTYPKHHPCFACGVGPGVATEVVIAASSESRHCWYAHRYAVDPLYGPTRVRYRVCE